MTKEDFDPLAFTTAVNTLAVAIAQNLSEDELALLTAVLRPVALGCIQLRHIDHHHRPADLVWKAEGWPDLVRSGHPCVA